MLAIFALLIPILPSLTQDQNVQAVQTEAPQVLEVSQPVHTISRFETKFETQNKKIERPVTYKNDPESEIGTEQIIQEGMDGLKTTTYKVLYFEGQQYSREVVSTEIKEPKEKVVSKGTKIIWRTLDTADGTISYWRKIRVWATHYDSHCPGCNEWTATGMRQGKGVIAVDPSVIKLGGKVYVPGYGLAVAGDTGGAIKGNVIDLGFEDAKTANWQAKFVDLYLLN